MVFFIFINKFYSMCKGYKTRNLILSRECPILHHVVSRQVHLLFISKMLYFTQRVHIVYKQLLVTTQYNTSTNSVQSSSIVHQKHLYRKISLNLNIISTSFLTTKVIIYESVTLLEKSLPWLSIKRYLYYFPYRLFNKDC